MRGTLEERFAVKWVEVPSGCHEWTAGTDGKGYGVIGLGTRAAGRKRASVVSWFFANGRWPKPGEVVRHTCDNPPCVNPAHLVIGTHADNTRDKITRGRHHNQVKDACRNGHPYAKHGGTRRFSSGRITRVCLTCIEEQRQAYKIIKRAKDNARYHARRREAQE